MEGVEGMEGAAVQVRPQQCRDRTVFFGALAALFLAAAALLVERATIVENTVLISAAPHAPCDVLYVVPIATTPSNHPITTTPSNHPPHAPCDVLYVASMLTGG